MYLCDALRSSNDALDFGKRLLLTGKLRKDADGPVMDYPLLPIRQ